MEEKPENKNKPYELFIRVGAALALIFLLSIAVFIEQDRKAFDDIPMDFGERIHEPGREALWNSTAIPLGDKGCQAWAGPYKYTDEDNDDWDFYSIQVVKEDGKVYHGCFEREFRLEDIPPELVEVHVREIVTYDAATRLVTFTLGETVHTYVLPPHTQ